jgi:hypothetical protein
LQLEKDTLAAENQRIMQELLQLKAKFTEESTELNYQNDISYDTNNFPIRLYLHMSLIIKFGGKSYDK